MICLMPKSQFDLDHGQGTKLMGTRLPDNGTHRTELRAIGRRKSIQ